MNDEEFEAFLKQLDALDAGQFEEVLAAMGRLAKKTFESGGDSAWLETQTHLEEAALAVSMRAGD